MEFILFLLLFISVLGIIVGVIKPEIALFWIKSEKTRLKAFYIYFGIIILLILIIGNTFKTENGYTYKLNDIDSTSNQLTMRIVIPSRFSKDTLIDIAKIEKEKRNWNLKFVCFFYLENDNIESTAWASVSYLPKCNNCATDKDKSNNDVQFSLIGLDANEANELNKELLNLSYNLKDGEILVAQFIDEVFKAKCQFIEIDSISAIKVIMWSNEKFEKQFFDIKVINGQRRFYYSNKNKNYDETVELYWTFNNEIGTLTLTGMPDYRVKLIK